MPSFIVSALDDRGAVVRLEQNAVTAQEASQRVVDRGYRVLAVKPTGWRLGTRRSSFPMILFAQELLALLRAGLNLTESLSGLAQRADTEQKAVLQGLSQQLREGKSFSQALTTRTDVFPDLFCALMAAAERTSDLPTALARYIDYATQVETLKKKMMNAALYPSLLLVVGGGVLLFLMTYVVPRFAGIYESLRGDLPWMSQALLVWGLLLRDHGGWVLLAALAVSAGLVGMWRRTAWRHSVWSWCLRWPRIARYVEGFKLARLYRALGMLLEGGIPLLEALQRVKHLLPVAEQIQLVQAGRAIEEGQSASTAFERYGLATPIAVQMLVVGERTGNLGGMLQRMAEFFEADTARALEAFARVFEPLLMALIGLVIGVVVILMYLPIFELAGSLQ